MKSKILLLTTLFFISIGTALGQTITVKGIVQDDKGDPVIGASVRLKSNPSVGAATGMDGDFTLKAKQGELIIVSYVGFKTQEVAAAPSLTIKLHPDTELLDDVVVVAYGTAKKQSLVGAQANISSKQLESRPITNVSSALAAAAPGVQAITASGQPGAGTSVMIRGFGSVNASSSPLYVVDGAIYTGPISDIAASDIASISILKDAASTALYGSSAGNGVILITTKSGQRGQSGKPSFNFTVNVGGSRRGQDRYETVNAEEYVQTMWRQAYNSRLYEQGYTPEQASLNANFDLLQNIKYQPFAGIKTDIGIDANTLKREGGRWYYDLTTGPKGSFDQDLYSSPLMVMGDGSLNPEITGLLWGDDLDWESHLFRTGLRREYALNSSYNNEKLTSFLSLSYLSEDGYKKYTDFSRLSSRVSLQYKINDWLKVGTNTSFTQTTVQSPKATLGKGYAADPFLFMSGIGPIYPIHKHNYDGSYVLNEDGSKVYDYSGGRPYSGSFNPVYEQQIDKGTRKRDALTSRSFIEISPLKGLTIRANYAYDLLTITSKTRYNNIMGDQPQGLLYIGKSRNETNTFNQLIDYKTSFDQHELGFLFGHESFEEIYEIAEMEKENMFTLGIDEMSNFSKMSSLESKTDMRSKEGYFARVNYDYDNRYNLSLSYRRDGSSRFAPDKRWGNFWSFGAGWTLSNESFMKETSSWLNFMKLRLSIGQTGNDNLSTWYAYQTLYSNSNNNMKRGLRISSVGNRNLVWEKQTSYDFAVEFSVFNRLSGTVEFFNKESDALIFDKPLPPSTGISSINENIGKVRNYGIEVDLKLNLLKTEDLLWDFNINGTFFKNKILTLPEANRETGIEYRFSKYVEGGSMKDFYLNEFIKVDDQNGRAIYRLDTEKYPSVSDPTQEGFAGLAKEGEMATWTYNGNFAKKHFCGSSIPTVYGGFGTSLVWKDLDFSLLLGYQLGGKIYDSGYAGMMGRQINSGSTFHKDILKAWKQPGDTSQIPALYEGAAGLYNNIISDRYLVSASSLMLKNISLGYNLPKSLARKVQLSNIRISVAGENLFFVSARKGLNPMGTYSGVASADVFGYAKTFTGSLTLTF